MKLKDYVNMHNSWNAHLEEEAVNEKAVSKAQQRFMGAVKGCQEDGDCPDGAIADTAASMKASDVDDFAGTKHKGLPEKKKKVDEAGRYHRSNYKGEDPRAQALDQAISLLNDLTYDSLEDDVASYADDAVRAMSKAIEELEYNRNTVGNDPEADAARGMNEGGMGDLHIEVQGALEEIMQEYGVRLEDIIGIIDDMQADRQAEADRMSSRDMMEDNPNTLTKEEFLKIVHEELQDEIEKQSEPEAYSMDDLRNMVREEVGGLIGDYKRSLEEGDEGNFITFSDGYKFKEVSKSYAASNWDKVDIYGIDLSTESEALIQSMDDLNGPWDAFGVEAGGSLEEASGNSKEDAIREIASSQEAGRIEGTKLDMSAASAVARVMDTLSPENKERYMAMPIDKMVSIAAKMFQ